MISNSIKFFSGLADTLIMEGMITENHACEAKQASQYYSISPLTYLVAKNIVPAFNIATIASKIFNLPFLDLDKTSYKSETIPWDFVNKEFSRRTYFLPLAKESNELIIATSDPSHYQAIAEIRFYTKMPIKLYIVEIDKLIRWMSSFIECADQQYLIDPSKLVENASSLTHKKTEDLTEPQTNIIDFINIIITKAIHYRISDIHFEPQERCYGVRWRHDGLLYEYMRLPKSASEAITVRLKIMAELDIAEHRLPQDGHFVHASTDCRMSTCPTAWGEKIVLRFLQLQKIPQDIQALGLLPIQQDIIYEAIQKPQGLILVTGPTGSGKTITLYALLRLLNQPNKNLVTIENPIEITMEGVNQINIHPKIGLNFSNLLRTILRQDPDIIMVGEIRDKETAETVLNAAQTGHLILSTLHTNNAVESLSRLIMMGISPFEIAHSCSVIIAQRLARRLCSHCKSPALTLKPHYEANLKGCTHCHQGYQGRIGIFEVLTLDKTLQTLIMEKATTEVIFQHAKQQGMFTLFEAGLMYVNQGTTTQLEIQRVIKN